MRTIAYLSWQRRFRASSPDNTEVVHLIQFEDFLRICLNTDRPVRSSLRQALLELAFFRESRAPI